MNLIESLTIVKGDKQMSISVIEVEKNGEIATVTLNRPEAMNAFSRELRGAIAEAFRDLQADNDTRVVILTGAGRAFCAGFDLKELASGSPDDAAFSQETDMQDAIAAFDRPIIGAINGHAITGGFELALACDILVASKEAKFADTHARVGMMPGWGLSQKLPRLIGIHRAKEISLTGNYITADQAELWGFVNRVVVPDELLPTCRTLAADIASCDDTVLRAYKKLIDNGYDMTFTDAMAYELTFAQEWMHKVTSGNISERREQVQKRGRQQNVQ